MKPWDNPEDKLNKKIRKVGRNAAYAFGGAIGIFLIAALYPKEENSEKITSLMGDVSLMLFIHGATLLAAIIFKKKLAPTINMLMTWIIIPSWLTYLFMQHSGSF